MTEYKNVVNRKHGKIRSKKLNSRVDLTAMVGVSFLLIAFFMITTELSRPQTISLTIPDHGGCHEYGGCYRGDRSLTILLGDNDKMVFYMGFLQLPLLVPKEIKYGKEGIRKELLKRNKLVLEYYAAIGKPKNGIIVIIKPSNKSNYRNLVDILDEMVIVGINTYTIDNYFSPEEKKLLEGK